MSIRLTNESRNSRKAPRKGAFFISSAPILESRLREFLKAKRSAESDSGSDSKSDSGLPRWIHGFSKTTNRSHGHRTAFIGQDGITLAAHKSPVYGLRNRLKIDFPWREVSSDSSFAGSRAALGSSRARDPPSPVACRARDPPSPCRAWRARDPPIPKRLSETAQSPVDGLCRDSARSPGISPCYGQGRSTAPFSVTTVFRAIAAISVITVWRGITVRRTTTVFRVTTVFRGFTVFPVVRARRVTTVFRVFAAFSVTTDQHRSWDESRQAGGCYLDSQRTVFWKTLFTKLGAYRGVFRGFPKVMPRSTAIQAFNESSNAVEVLTF